MKWPEYLEAWFSGEADAETTQALLAWRQASPENERLFRAYQRALVPHPPDWAQQLDVNRSWQELLPRLTEESGQEAAAETSHRITWRIHAVAAAAASVLLLLAWWMMSPKVHRLQVAAGQKMVWLPDSSQVLLNEHSVLTYEEGFGEEHRNLTLEGQGFFEVRPDKQLPFRIKSKAAITQVVGTSFDLQAYPSQARERLAVVTGVVQYQPLSPEGKPIGAPRVVKAGQSLTSQGTAGGTVFNPAIPIEQLIWSGRLVFQQATLEQVLDVMERYYGKQFVLENPAAGKCLLTASFYQEKPSDVLDVIALSMRMEWKQQGETYLLSGNGCTNDI
ncbi:FecR family protein [Pontibacter actiniarum]|uniref:FecR family protein n=1 Tax=Pontibacter actiniarum TaxID=323450 RepID=UPI00042660DF|nr:FecR domain-containing protein [Pontibacter actiniarum]